MVPERPFRGSPVVLIDAAPLLPVRAASLLPVATARLVLPDAAPLIPARAAPLAPVRAARLVHPLAARPAPRRAARFLAFAFACLLAGCSDPTAPSPDAGADASIASPLAAEPPEPLDAGAPGDGGIIGIPADSSGRLLLPDGGAPPPVPFSTDGALRAEPPGSRDLAGVAIESAFHWRDLPLPPKAPEVSLDGLKEAAKLTVLNLHIDATDGGRVRIELGSRALPLPARTELRARADRWGHLLLWPNATDYRVVPVGALRALLGERRIDVMPVSPGQVKPAGEGRRLGVVVRKVEVTSPLGVLRLELGKVSEAGEGGPVLCRTFIEMLGVDPKLPLCTTGEVPLLATYAWQEGGGISWEASALTRRTDFPNGDFVVPPAGATYAPSGLPIAPGGVLLSRDELTTFRTAALNPPATPDPSAPGEGFVAVNQTDVLLYLLLDGIPVAIVPPLNEKYVIGTQRGHYQIQWRTFLGEKVLPPVQLDLPARFTTGGSSDAGASDGGK